MLLSGALTANRLISLLLDVRRECVSLLACSRICAVANAFHPVPMLISDGEIDSVDLAAVELKSRGNDTSTIAVLA